MWEKVVYLGKIGRQLQICLNGHIDVFLKNQRNKSAFASHLLESGHSEKMVKVSLLHEEHRWPRGLLSLSLSLPLLFLFFIQCFLLKLVDFWIVSRLVYLFPVFYF